MTNSYDAMIDAALAAIDALIDCMINRPATIDSPIDSTDLIDDILNDDATLPNAIRELAFDDLDLDDEMLTIRIQNRIDA